MYPGEGAIVLFSGGQDSTTCLYWALRHFAAVHAIGFHYGQRHSVELAQAHSIAAQVGVPFHIYPLPALQEMGGNALTDLGIAVGTSTPQSDALPNTFVPGRNLVFLTLAAGYAYQHHLGHIVGGMCQTDYSGYPDCREPFIRAAEIAVGLALDRPLQIHTPLMFLTKAQTWLLANELGCLETVRLQSHTCYNGDRQHLHPWGYGCGNCPACELRARGYSEAFPAERPTNGE